MQESGCCTHSCILREVLLAPHNWNPDTLIRIITFDHTLFIISVATLTCHCWHSFPLNYFVKELGTKEPVKDKHMPLFLTPDLQDCE